MPILVNNKAHGFTDGLTVGGINAPDATLANSKPFLNPISARIIASRTRSRQTRPRLQLDKHEGDATRCNAGRVIARFDVLNVNRTRGRHDIQGDIFASHERLWCGKTGANDQRPILNQV
jgi:hypothetical protein